MQVSTLDTQQLADTLSEGTILDTVDHGALRMHVLTYEGQDVLTFTAGGETFIVYPPESFDAESGGSIHDHARFIKAEALASAD